MAPRAWTDHDDRQLLLVLIKDANISPNWKKVGEQLDRTDRSVAQRFDKLRKMTAGDSVNGSPSPSADAAAKPTKAAATKGKGKYPAKARGKRGVTADEEDEEDGMKDEEEDGGAVKKVKLERQEVDGFAEDGNGEEL